jgi:Flp pilus assembly protein TadB
MEGDPGDEGPRRRPRRLVWSPPHDGTRQRPLSAYARVYAGLAVVVVLFGVLTGGSVVRAVGYALVVFVVAVAWTAWRLRRLSRGGDRRRGER